MTLSIQLISVSLNFKLFLKIIIALFFFLLFLSFFGLYNSIRPSKIVSSVTPADEGFVYEDVSFITSDRIKLIGWWLPSNDPAAKTLILLHGYPADKGDIFPSLAFLNKKYNLLLFDFRYLGQSGGSYSTVGAKETEDLRAAINFLKSSGVNEVGVWGFSMGGAVALMSAENLPEIKAIVSESSYARLDIMVGDFYRIPLLKHPLAKLTSLWARLFLGIDAHGVSPMDSVKDLNIPILLMHGMNDEVVPFKHAELLKEALKNNSKAEFWFRENLSHGQFDKEYQKRIEDFFQRNL